MNILKIIVASTLYLFTAYSVAAFVYITDEVDIPIRSDKTFGENIIRSAPSGVKLKILKTDSDGWTQIQLENTKGWVISRYLTNNPPARVELEKLKISANRNALLVTRQKEKIAKLESNMSTLAQENKSNKISSIKAISEKKHIEKTYADALKIEYKNNKLKQENLNLQSEIKLLKIGNEAQVENSNRTWFLYGGFVLFLGVLIGFIVSVLKNRR